MDVLLTTIFVVVDDWYQKQVKSITLIKPKVKASMSDNEIMTLALAMDYLPFSGETQFLGLTREITKNSFLIYLTKVNSIVAYVNWMEC